MRQPRYLFQQLLLLVAVVSVPLVLLQGYNLYLQATRAREAASQAVVNYASNVAYEAETLVTDTKQYLAFLSARPLILALDRERCDPLLEGVTRRRRHVANVLVVDARGRPVCLSVTDPGSVPEVLTEFDWFRGAMGSDSVTISKPFFAPIVRKPVLAVSQPLRNQQGARVGTLTVLLDLEGLQNQWARFSLPPGSRISIFDAGGTILATRPDFHARVGTDAAATLRNARALNPGDVGIAPGLDGIERVFALKPVEVANWHAGVAVPTAFIFGPAYAQLKRSLAVAAILIVALFSLGFVIARRMIVPLQDLVAVARAVRAGETDRRASQDVPGEYQEVAREFNAMLDSSRRQTDFYAALSRTNGAIVRSRDAQLLYDEICRICVEHGHASIAYISLARGNAMSHVAWAGPAKALLGGLDVQPGDAHAERSGLSGLAVWTGERQISNDVIKDARKKPWRDLLDAIGTKAIAACPFRQGGVTVGALTLHMTVPGFFDARVIALLDEMTEDISFALDNFVRIDALAREEKKLAGLVDTAMDAIISVDSSHKIRLFNRAACEMFRLQQSDALGTSVDRFIPGRLRVAHDAHLHAFARTGSTARRMGTHELVALRADGSEFPIDASISRLGDGDAALMTVVIRDVTELRLAQQAKLAQVAAESANRAKTEFLSRMSHELRTPLNAILGFSQLLQGSTDEPLTPLQYGRVEQVRVAGWHLLALINDVLDVSKIESGHVSLKLQTVDLQASLDEAVRIAAPIADAAGVRILTPYRDEVPVSVRADAQRLRQVMINLISNAIKYNRPEGTIEIGVSGDREQTHVDVTDTGLGMNEGQLAHLFEPFNRLGRERDGIEGTGLGLTLARHLTQLMGGTIEVRSEPDVGTQVRVSLSTQMAGDREARGSTIAETQATDADDPALSGTVLYVEDNAINFLLVEQLFRRWPRVRLLHAEAGIEAIDLARSSSIDLVLLDMRLPDLDGLQVLAELRKHAATRQTRVIALSASAMPEDIDAATNAGALHYWTKPLDFARFIQDMRQLLASRPTDAPLPGQTGT